MSLVAEVMRDRPYVLIRGGEQPSDTTNGGYDVSRNGRHGDYNGTGHFGHPGPRGAGGRATELNNTNALIIPSAELPSMVGSTTISVWFKGTYSSTNDTQQLVSRGLNRFLQYFNRPTSGRMTCYWGANNEGEALATSGQTLWNDNRWHHWVWVRDTAPATPLLLIYVDGHLDASKSEVGAAPTTGGDLQCTASNTSTSVQFTCLAMWDRVLPPARILAHYRAGMGLH